MKLNSKSKYLVKNTIVYSSCVLNDTPAHDFVA